MAILFSWNGPDSDREGEIIELTDEGDRICDHGIPFKGYCFECAADGQQANRFAEFRAVTFKESDGQ